MVVVRVLGDVRHVKERQTVKISEALHYALPHNRIVILARKTSDNVIKKFGIYLDYANTIYIFAVAFG